MAMLRLARALVVVACLGPLGTAGALAVHPPRPGLCEAEPTPVEALGDEGTGSGVVLGVAGKREIAFVADADDDRVYAFDLHTGRFITSAVVPRGPSQLVLHRGTLYVVARETSELHALVLDGRALSPRHECLRPDLVRDRRKVRTATEPVAIARTWTGGRLLVTSASSHTLEVFDTASLTPVARYDLPREPRGVTIAGDGRHAFVAHAAGSVVSVIDLLEGKNARTIPIVSVDHESLPRANDDPRTLAADFGFGRSGDLVLGLGLGSSSRGTFEERPRLPRFAGQGFAIMSLSVQGRDLVFLPEALSRPGDAPKPADAPRTSSYGAAPGPDVNPAVLDHVLVVDASETPERLAPSLTVADTSCLLPRGIAADRVREVLYVACIDSALVVAYDGRRAHPEAFPIERWHVPDGPSAVAIDPSGSRLAIWSSFDRVFTAIDRDKQESKFGSPITGREPTPFEVGRKIFHTSNAAAISADGRACASCHPDGRDDGLTWTTPLGPRQTPTLAGRLASSAPFGWHGESATVREHLDLTLRRLGGLGLGDRQMYALLTYLAKMKPPPRPSARLADPAGPVARGAAIFASYEAGCSSCHASKNGKAVGDGDVHDIGSSTRGDDKPAFATPSLEQVGHTAPYFHDGRYASLRDLLRDPASQMGSTSHLSESDLDALEKYLGTL